MQHDDENSEDHSSETHKLSPIKKKKTTAANCPCEMDVTIPHGQCSATSGESAGIIHPGEGVSCAMCKEEEEDSDRKESQQRESPSSSETVSY